MRTAVITPGFFSNRRAVRMFAESCKVHGIEPIYYCEGEQYCMWATMKIQKKIPILNDLLSLGYTHVLYTDSRDAFFLGAIHNIEIRYSLLGSPPMLASAEVDCNPSSDYESYYPQGVGPYRFHCVGGYIAELSWVIEKFTQMLPYIKNTGDDADIWQWGYKDGWFKPMIDHTCLIFQTENKAHLRIEDGRLLNEETGNNPLVFHINGGYSSPVDGKYDRMLPYWNALYPDIPLTKEDCSI